jgi:nickel transport protein
MTRVGPRPLTLIWAVLAVFLLTGPALAHRVNMFAYVEGDEVVVECSYSRSERVRFGDVEVTNAATGALLLTGKTDEKGTFRFPVPPAARAAKADLKIVLRAGEGHQTGGVIKADEYLSAAPAATVQPAPAAAPAMSENAPVLPAAKPSDAPTGVSPTAQMAAPLQAAPTTPQAGVGVGMDPAALEALVERAVEKKIAPLRAMLVGEKEKGPGLTEIIGGIGWLVGLAGVAAFVDSRQKRRPGA